MSTLNPMGTFGTGYDVGNYGQQPRLDTPTGGGRRSHSSSASIGVVGEDNFSPPPAETLTFPAAIPQFSYTSKAGRRVDFVNESLNAVRYLWTAKTLLGAIVTSSSQEHPVFFFPDVGETTTYSVTLRAYNADGDYVETTTQIAVEDITPVCDFTYVVSGTIVRFTDISNIDSDNNLWTFGDGEVSTEENPHHTYSGNGTYSVKLTKGSWSKIQFITIDAEVVVSCDAVSGATGYKWEYSTDGVIWTQFADTASESLGVTEAVHGVDPTALNYFRVKAYNDAGESDYSDITNVRCE